MRLAGGDRHIVCYDNFCVDIAVIRDAWVAIPANFNTLLSIFSSPLYMFLRNIKIAANPTKVISFLCNASLMLEMHLKHILFQMRSR